ncbi:MAG TPA: hypothetical protein VMA09_03230 [Candidatus Binataceae bacterium]|nr:hypothetical protein [Candidatus Binataceae bacterium]
MLRKNLMLRAVSQYEIEMEPPNLAGKSLSLAADAYFLFTIFKLPIGASD